MFIKYWKKNKFWGIAIITSFLMGMFLYKENHKIIYYLIAIGLGILGATLDTWWNKKNNVSRY